MTVLNLTKTCDLEPVHIADPDAEITGCYIGDMLSVVMSKAEEGNVWLTVQGNVNVAAVALLTGVSAIVIVEGLEPDEETVKKAAIQNITLLKSKETAFHLACRIKEQL